VVSDHGAVVNKWLVRVASLEYFIAALPSFFFLASWFSGSHAGSYSQLEFIAYLARTPNVSHLALTSDSDKQLEIECWHFYLIGGFSVGLLRGDGGSISRPRRAKVSLVKK